MFLRLALNLTKSRYLDFWFQMEVLQRSAEQYLLFCLAKQTRNVSEKCDHMWSSLLYVAACFLMHWKVNVQQILFPLCQSGRFDGVQLTLLLFGPPHDSKWWWNYQCWHETDGDCFWRNQVWTFCFSYRMLNVASPSFTSNTFISALHFMHWKHLIYVTMH